MVCILYLVLCAVMAVASCEDMAPWIAILGVPSQMCDTLRAGPSAHLKDAGGSCFTSLYDKWIQASGARAVGIPHDAFDSNITALNEILRSVNGVFFTGGGLDLSDVRSPYYQTASYIFDQVKRFNDAGVHYPLHGHCMGFQLLNILAAGGNSSVLLTHAFDSEQISLPLEWTDSAKDASWVQAMPQAVYDTFTNENSTYNIHHNGVSPEMFYANSLLSDFFNAVSTNHDQKGATFVSTVEAKQYPIFGAQWHSERTVFEWRTDCCWQSSGKTQASINHTAHATAANMWTGIYFVEEARRNEPQDRNMDLLRQFVTYSMHRETVGDVLTGYEYLRFPGFSAATAVSV